MLSIGPIPPVITPFTDSGEVDYDAFAFNLEKWMEAGIKGFLLFGSNSEAVFLDQAEKVRLIRLAARVCAGQARILAGTGLESTRATVELTHLAAQHGAEAALVLTPHYYKDAMDDEALYSFFTSLADASEIPVLVYNVPKYTGINVSPALIRQLAAHPGIVGMKDSSGDLARFAGYQEAGGEGFNVLPGTASLWYPALVLGAQTGIMALANCLPEACLDMYRLFREDAWEEAEHLYRKIIPLNIAVTSTYGIAGLKYACSLRGFKAGKVRPPLRELGKEQRQSLESLFPVAEKI